MKNDLIISHKEPFLTLLDKINNNEGQAIYVVNNINRVLGVITDGDIRRGLLNGLSKNDPIINFMQTDFHFINEKDYNVRRLVELREKKLKSVPILDKEGKIKWIIDFKENKSFLPVDAVIMAGGKGTRLRPLTDKVPKPLIKINQKEIISYNFDRLFSYGIYNQNITVNYKGHQIKKYCKNYHNNKINFNVVEETEFLGTAGSLSLIENFSNDTILLMNSDILTNIDYEDFYLEFKRKNADIMVASYPYKVTLPYAIFELNSGNINSLNEKPTYTYYANAGIYMFKKEILKYIPENSFYNATDLMDKVISEHKKLIHYPITSYWLDIGKLPDLEKAKNDIFHIDFSL